MNLSLRTSECNPARLESFLAGELSFAQEQELTLHLDTCESCRHLLEQHAAEPESWREAEELLKPAEFDAPIPGDDIDAEVTRPFTRQPLQIQAVLDALGPTDDPDMLGRLGGYEVSGVVGAGGMGVVLKAIDKSLDRTVAIKVLAPHLATSGAARKRFAREAKAAAAVLHSNVIAIHSVSNDESLPYLVMPYVRGSSLQKRLDREGPLSLQEILRIGSQIAAGLAAAHAQGLVHRDIKPANILLEEGVERVTLTDFGLARAVDDATITHSGMIAGTPQYMSPEQARGEAVDGRSDLFSLGSVLYAICTGRPPFRAETSYGVMRRITDDEPTPISQISPDIPDWLASIIARLMSKRAADRFESAAQVTVLLEACLAHVQQPATVPLPQSCLSLRERSTIGSEQLAANSRRSTFIAGRWPGVIAMIAAFGLGLLGMFLWQGSTPPDIAGKWTGEEWGEVVLEEQRPGEYEGTYTDTFKNQPGTINVKWSRVERRFHGTWREGDDRFGKLSLRLVDKEIRGAWTTSKKSDIEPGTPRLADLTWTKAKPLSDKIDKAVAKDISEPKRLESIQIRIAAPKTTVVTMTSQTARSDKLSRLDAPIVNVPDGGTVHLAGSDKPKRLDMPARLNLKPEKSYRLTLSEISDRPGLEVVATIAIPESAWREQFLKRNAIPLDFTDEDFHRAATRQDAFHKILFLDKRLSETVVRTLNSAEKDAVEKTEKNVTVLCSVRIESGSAIGPTEKGARDGPAAAPKFVRNFETDRRIKHIAYSADGKLVAIANDRSTLPAGSDWKRAVKIIDGETGKVISSPQLTSKDEYFKLAATKSVLKFEVEALAMSPDGSLVAVGTGIGQVKLFNTRTGELVRSLDDEKAKLEDKKSPEKLKAISRAMGSVISLAFSPDGGWLATCGGSFDDVPLVVEETEPENRRLRLGRRATGPGRLKVWEVKTGELKHDLVGHSDASAVCFSPDGKQLASSGRWGGDRDNGTGAILWDPITGEQIRTITTDANGGTRAIAFSPDGKRVAIGSQTFDKDKENDSGAGIVSVAHVATGILEWKQTVPHAAGRMAFLPDGKSMLVLCGSRSIRFLKSETGHQQHEILAGGASPGGPWSDFAISSAGPRLAVGGVAKGGQGNIELWEIGRSLAATTRHPVRNQD